MQDLVIPFTNAVIFLISITYTISSGKISAWEALEDHLSPSSAPVSATASDTDPLEVAAFDLSECY